MPFKFVEELGRVIINFHSSIGDACLFIIKVAGRCLSPPWKPKLVLQQINSIGTQSIFVVALVGLFTGAVLAVQGVYTLTKFGATAYTGPAVALSLIRELGPVLTALMVNGRAGSAMCAELGIMKITEQVDALRAMSVDPLRYLMAPRIIAGIIAVPILTAIFNVLGIIGGYIIGVFNLGLPSGTFIAEMTSAVEPIDVNSGILKSLVFGFIIVWVSCYKGWTCNYGAVGVNKATTSSVVITSVAVLVMDYFLTSILTQVFL